MDPLEAYSRWHRWAICGTPDQIDRVLASLDADPPPGWKRLAGNELAAFHSLVKKGSAWYGVDAAAALGGLAVSLDRSKDNELRGGLVRFPWMGSPGSPADVSASWNDIMRFFDHGLAPAAGAAGATVCLPSHEDVFFAELPIGVRDQLKEFSDAARKSLPLNREEAERWHEFVVAAFRSKTVIEGDSLVRWLTANGWPQEPAKELSLRFLDESLLLSRFIEEVLAV